MALPKPAVPGAAPGPVAVPPNMPLGSQNTAKQSSPQAASQIKQSPLQPSMATKAGLGKSAGFSQKLPNSPTSKTRGLWIAIVLVGLFSVGSVGVLGFFVMTSGAELSNTATVLEDKMQQQLDTLQTSVNTLETSTGDITSVGESVKMLEDQASAYPSKKDVEKNAEIHKQSDADLDGLSNYDEVIIYGTNPNEKDSDGDGFNDKAEIDNGFNPIGDGDLVLKTDEGVDTSTSDTSASTSGSDGSTSDTTSGLTTSGNTSDTTTSGTGTDTSTSSSTETTPSTSTGTSTSEGTQAFGN